MSHAAKFWTSLLGAQQSKRVSELQPQPLWAGTVSWALAQHPRSIKRRRRLPGRCVLTRSSIVDVGLKVRLAPQSKGARLFDGTLDRAERHGM